MEKEAKKLADQTVNEREFIAACNRLADGATKLDKDFKKKIDELSEDVGPIPGHMIGILDDLDNGAKILTYFTANPDEYEELIAFPTIKAGVKLTRLSEKLAKVPEKKISKAPPPIDSLKGGKSDNSFVITEADTKNMSEFVRKRNAQIEARRKAKMAGQR